MTAIEYFLDELLGAAPAGAAPSDVETLASDALDRGLPQATPEAVIACISVADCTSRNPLTQVDLVHAKIRRMGIDILRRLHEVTSDLGMARPQLHIRLRHSPALLAGHGLDVWPQLARTIGHAAREAGATRTTLPVVCWDLPRFSEMLPDVLPSLVNADVRMDFCGRPGAYDLQCLSTALVLAKSPPSARYVISNQRTACPVLHPETVELRVQSVLADLSTDAPAVRRALARTLARTNRHFAHSLAAGREYWCAGDGYIERRPAAGLQLPSLPDSDSIASHLGWPIGCGGPRHLALRPDTTPDQLEAGLARSLSEPGYVVVSGATASSGPS